jgi:hypothetical protein
MKRQPPIHLRVNGVPLCGTKKGRAVNPHDAKFVTCKRCLVSLRRLAP